MTVTSSLRAEAASRAVRPRGIWAWTAGAASAAADGATDANGAIDAINVTATPPARTRRMSDRSAIASIAFRSLVTAGRLLLNDQVRNSHAIDHERHGRSFVHRVGDVRVQEEVRRSIEEGELV